MSFSFSPATRVGVKPLIGLYGESNSGKTFSALLLARGLAGPSGKVFCIDTESGRAALYADQVPGGFLRADFAPPFSPGRYMEALDVAEGEGADVIVLDSFSHEWFGEGGVLDQAADNEERTKKAGLHNWKQPKLEHARLVMRLMRAKTFVIVCLRAKFKSRQVKDSNGKSTIVKDDHVSPLQDEDLLFEMTCHAEMQAGSPGMIRLTKWSVPDLAQCFPEDAKEQLGVKHGEAIARWAAGGGKASPVVGSPISTPATQDDFFLMIREAVDAGELTRLVAEANGIDDAGRKRKAKLAIQERARTLKLTWQPGVESFIEAA
jgi:hypothetical protein